LWSDIAPQVQLPPIPYAFRIPPIRFPEVASPIRTAWRLG